MGYMDHIVIVKSPYKEAYGSYNLQKNVFIYEPSVSIFLEKLLIYEPSVNIFMGRVLIYRCLSQSSSGKVSLYMSISANPILGERS